MHPSKVQNVLGMPGEQRFGYFIRKVADCEEVWGLFDSGWAMAATDDGRRLLPLWPEQEFASLCCVDEWQKYSPKRIELQALLSQWLPGMQKDNILAAVFPTPADRGVVVSPESLGKTLEGESAQYE